MFLLEGASAGRANKLPDHPTQDSFPAHYHPHTRIFSRNPGRVCISNFSQCWGFLNSKTHHPIPLQSESNFTEKLSSADPRWVQEEPESPGPRVLNSIKHVGSVAEKKKVKVKRKGIRSETQQHKEEGISKVSAQDGCGAEAFFLVNLLKVHTKLKDLWKGTQTHANIIQKGLLDKNVFIGCALLNMYAKCGAFEKAQAVFDELPIRNIASWNALITGYTQHGYCEDALKCYVRMQLESFSPNAVTFSSILSACGSIQASQLGQDIHACIIKAGLLEGDVVLGNSLVDMYAKCGSFTKAQEVLGEICFRDVVSYSALIVGYTQHGHAKEAFDCYERMEHEGLEPKEVTFAGILKACGCIGARNKGQEIHAHIVMAGLEKDTLVGTAVLDMYSNCGSLVEAQDVFDELSIHDVVSWNALMAGYTEHELGEKASDCFVQMQVDGFSPNVITFACMLKACGNLGAFNMGQGIHAQIVKVGLLDEDLVRIGLVGMYADCGMLREVKEKLPIRNLVSCSAFMVGYAQLGKDEEVFNLLEGMIGEGTTPDSVIVTIVLNTCSHEGLVCTCEIFLKIFGEGFAIFPTLEHHTCLVDLFGRAGHFDKALAIIKDMPFLVNLATWHTLLGACRKWGNVKLGAWVFEQAICLDQKDAETYACMCNMYA